MHIVMNEPLQPTHDCLVYALSGQHEGRCDWNDRQLISRRKKPIMNTGLKNKLLIMATAAGMAGFGVACGSSEAPPAAEEGGSEETVGGEATCSGEGSCSGAATPEAEGEATPADAAPEAAEGAEGEASCGEGSCS